MVHSTLFFTFSLLISSFFFSFLSFFLFLFLGKAHNSNWLRYLCQTRPPVPQALWKEVFERLRHKAPGALVVDSRWTRGALLAPSWCNRGALAEHLCGNRGALSVDSWCNRSGLMYSQKWIFPSFEKDFTPTPRPPPPSRFRPWLRFLARF